MTVRVQVLKELELPEQLFDRPTIHVSDLHQNVAGDQDNFQEFPFVDYLRTRPAERWRLVIVGDRRDLHEALAFVPRHGGDREAEVRAAIIAHNGFADRAIARYDPIGVAGNHDELERRGSGWGGRYALVTERCVVIHGHQLDPACSRYAWVGRSAACVWGVIENLHLAKVLGWAKDLAQRAWFRRTRTLRGAIGNAAQTDWVREHSQSFQLVIFGHTHEAGLELAGEAIWGNCGCWVEPGVGYAIEVEGRVVRLVKITA